ncbi:glycosyltransferase [Tomitella cavernea]|uniref:Glycosyltransferase n=1 Tax=Tomitella cavernea TaxID=1387982 RepID=A0ABP9C6N5_9ACTN|nr:glycosyltransferase [Tomitella cavernea]
MQTANARRLVQRNHFAGPEDWVSEDLYSKVTHGVARRLRSEIALQPGAEAHTNAYFGRFEASYWQRWTGVTAVRVRAEVRVGRPDSAEPVGAHGTVRVRASDIAGHERTVDFASVDAAPGDGPVAVEFDAPIDKFLDGGAMWLEFRAGDLPLTVDGVHWTVGADDAREGRLPNAVAICTFNRADDCAATVAALASDPEVLGVIDHVYVTDQGTDTVDSRPVFTGAAAVLGERLHYLRQPNLGGAGGFSRGMYEVTGRAGQANVLLMDDDVRVEPETVLRMTAFADHTASPMLVGAQMLYLYNPDYLLLSAEGDDLSALKAGLPADAEALHDQSVIDNVQERRIDAPYNAWWSCLIPASVIREIGLPMPYFFQWDDIEYGIRARGRGFPTVTLPGASVWHADFYWKDGDDFGQFFGLRNSLITAAVHSGFDVRDLSKELSRRVLSTIVAMQYGFAETLLAAVDAFLEGPDALADGGQELLARVRELRSGHPETQRLPVSAMPASAQVRRVVGPLDEDKADLVLAKKAARQLSGRVEAGPVAVPYEDSFWWHVSAFGEVYVTDASQGGVRRRRRDAAQAKALTKRLASTLRRFVAEGPAAQDAYRAAVPTLTSRENWARLYGIGPADTTVS